MTLARQTKRAAASLVCGVTFLTLPAAHAQAPGTPSLYRVFLQDGASLASVGEWLRVGDHIVFSMPLDPAGDTAALHLVSLPLQRVDVPRSQRYADAVRAANYVAARGDADFAQLSDRVARTLNQIAFVEAPADRLRLAAEARRTLSEWPAAHFGYRQAEVDGLLGVLDELIAGLRASAGSGPFDIALSARTVAPPPEPLQPSPSHGEIAAGMLSAAAAVDVPAERVSLLQSLVLFLDRAVEYLPVPLATALRGEATEALAAERRVDATYQTLRSDLLSAASRHAAQADVRSLQGLRQRLQSEDARLGARRPQDIAALTAVLDGQIDAAHRLRLAQDQWLLVASDVRAYRTAVAPFVRALAAHAASFDDIKLLAGPPPHRLAPLARELRRSAQGLALLTPPAPVAAAHDAFRSAYSLAENAVRLRRDAVAHTDVELARRASAAASGAVLLLARARSDLRSALQSPVPLSSRVP